MNGASLSFQSWEGDPSGLDVAEDRALSLIEWLRESNATPAEKPSRAKRGRPRMNFDPDADAILRAYSETGNIKDTISKLKLESLNRVTPHKRVQRIVNADKQAKSRAKNTSCQLRSSSLQIVTTLGARPFAPSGERTAPDNPRDNWLVTIRMSRLHRHWYLF